MNARAPDPVSLLASLRAEARRLGFDAFGVVRAADARDNADRLGAWLAAGAHGDMHWMAETRERRAHPSALWPDVRSILVFGMNYGPHAGERRPAQPGPTGVVSVYARNRDYHELMKGRLKLFAARLQKLAGPNELKVFVDTAPVMEKPLAQAAGLGWQGKHTNLVSREFGSWLFLGALFTTLDLPADAPGDDLCGACRACLVACPTAAFPAPYRLDARRCIAYLTNEHKGVIAREFRAAIGDRIYGCDDCLAACPWNKFAQEAREAKLLARADLERPRLDMLLAQDEAAFRAFFAGNPVKRIGHARFLRNVLIAAGNAGAPALAPLVEQLLGHASPLVRGAAVWALARLASPQMFVTIAAARAVAETDESVREEWRIESAERSVA